MVWPLFVATWLFLDVALLERAVRESALPSCELEEMELGLSKWYRAGRGRVRAERLPSVKGRRHQRPVKEQLGSALNSLPVASLETILAHAAKFESLEVDKERDCDVEALRTMESVCRLWQAIVRHEVEEPCWLDVDTVLEMEDCRDMPDLV